MIRGLNGIQKAASPNSLNHSDSKRRLNEKIYWLYSERQCRTARSKVPIGRAEVFSGAVPFYPHVLRQSVAVKESQRGITRAYLNAWRETPATKAIECQRSWTSQGDISRRIWRQRAIANGQIKRFLATDRFFLLQGKLYSVGLVKRTHRTEQSTKRNHTRRSTA